MTNTTYKFSIEGSQFQRTRVHDGGAAGRRPAEAVSESLHLEHNHKTERTH